MSHVSTKQVKGESIEISGFPGRPLKPTKWDIGDACHRVSDWWLPPPKLDHIQSDFQEFT